jgi:arylsulfatase A-like enzyme
MPEILRNSGVSTHLVTDHYHYFEDGGGTYHPRYSTWQFFRGQEGDPWMGQVQEPLIPPTINAKGRRQDWVNRQFIREEPQFPQVQTFAAGLDFIERNHAEGSWMLHIETFDPHEPFYAPDTFQKLYPHAGEQPIFDWPEYKDVTESPEEIRRLRANYAAVLSMCDAQLGKVLDAMDRHDMWKDTMLVVWTDHGFLLSEHDRWGKNIPNLWNEIAHTPFFVWDPRSGCHGQRRQALVQPSIDLPPTLLRFFGKEPTSEMRGHDLAQAIALDAPVREAAIFGYFGMTAHCTDGDYMYIRHPHSSGGPLDEYTWMTTSMRARWDLKRFRDVRLELPMPFTKGITVPRLNVFPANDGDFSGVRHLLFDQVRDHGQAQPLDRPDIEARMKEHLVSLLHDYHAPEEQFQRLGIQR